MNRHLSTKTIKAIIIPISVIVMFSLVSAVWDSHDRLKTLNYVLGWTLAIAAVAAFIVSTRVETIEDQQKAAEDTAEERRRALSAEQIATANKEAAKANEGLAKATLDIEDRKKENLQLSLQLTSETRERVTLAKLLELRRIESRRFNSMRFIELRGTQIKLIAEPSPEPIWLAWQIGQTLRCRGWKVLEFRTSEKPLTRGIRVDLHTEGDLSDEDRSRASEADSLLTDALAKSGLSVSGSGSGRKADIPSAVITISVGPSERLSAPKIENWVTGGGKASDPLKGLDIKDLPPLVDDPEPQPTGAADAAKDSK